MIQDDAQIGPDRCVASRSTQLGDQANVVKAATLFPISSHVWKVAMKYALFFYLIFLPKAALAHWGHVAEVAGHGHLIGLAALGAAIGVAIWLGADSEEETTDEEEPVEEAAEA